MAIRNEALSQEQRKISSQNYIENLEKFLNLRESTKYNDDELRTTLGGDVVSETKKVNINGRETNLRILRYDGLPELFGTLARKWTYLQWWDDKTLRVQCLDKKGADVATDLIVLKAKDKTIMLLAGYQTPYAPHPVFLSAWQWSDDQWDKVDLFERNISSGDAWEITKYENSLTIEGKPRSELSVEQNQQRDGFVVSSKANGKKLEFRLSGEQIAVCSAAGKVLNNTDYSLLCSSKNQTIKIGERSAWTLNDAKTYYDDDRLVGLTVYSSDYSQVEG